MKTLVRQWLIAPDARTSEWIHKRSNNIILFYDYSNATAWNTINQSENWYPNLGAPFYSRIIQWLTTTTFLFILSISPAIVTGPINIKVLYDYKWDSGGVFVCVCVQNVANKTFLFSEFDLMAKSNTYIYIH